MDEGKITYSKEELLEKIKNLPDDSFITVDSHYDIYDETSELVFEASTERLETEEELNYHELKHVDSCFTGNSPRLLRNNFL